MPVAEDFNECVLRRYLAGGLVLGLYVGELPPRLRSDTTFTEPKVAGYEPKRLPLAAWAVRGELAEAAAVRFVFDGPAGEVSGWYLQTSDGETVAAEPLPGAPFVGRTKGDFVEVTPTLELEG